MKPIIILGSTGSIGTQALSVVAAHPDRFHILGLAAGANAQLLAEQCRRFQVKTAALAVGDAEAAAALTAAGVDSLLVGSDSASQLVNLIAEQCQQLGYEATEVTVLNGVTGGIGLTATLATLEANFTLALANKESLVVGGPLVKAAFRRPAQIVPVDSEHSAIAQALLSGKHRRGLTVPIIDGETEVAELILTASGGPFRGCKTADLEAVTPEQALAHPTWQMGPMVTINSSTLMNKALEFIEAHLLFDIPPAQIVPVIHPQSLLHSAVTWQDGSTIGQISPPDMKLPIALGLTWPERMDPVSERFDFTRAASLTFEPVDHETFPALRLAQQALEAGPTAPAVLNRANEVLVEAFLSGRLGYLQIIRGVAEVLSAQEVISDPTLEDVFQVQDWAAAKAQEYVKKQK